MTNPHQAPRALSATERATTRDVLARLREGGDLIVAGRDGPVALPKSIARDVVTLLEAFADGRPLVMAAADEEVGAQEAASILNLSRPTVVRFLEEGRIPSRRPGKHRRVRVSDLIAFRARLEQDRAAALDELALLTQAALESARDHGTLTDEMT